MTHQGCLQAKIGKLCSKRSCCSAPRLSRTANTPSSALSHSQDPNLTDKKFPGNPTKSYRSREPLRVTGEITDWQGHSLEALKAMKDNIERFRQLGIEAIDE